MVATRGTCCIFYCEDYLETVKEPAMLFGKTTLLVDCLVVCDPDEVTGCGYYYFASILLGRISLRTGTVGLCLNKDFVSFSAERFVGFFKILSTLAFVAD